MSSSTHTSIVETDVLYSKAARLELEQSYDDAFALYVRSAQSYLHWAKNDPNARTRERCKQEAKKCLDRAELIKRSKKELRPLVKDPFSREEQLFALNKSEKIHGARYRKWDYSLEAVADEFYDQPPLGKTLSDKGPIWRRPREVYAESRIMMASPSLEPHHIVQNIVTDCSVCSSIAVCLRHHRLFNSKLGLSCVYPQTSEGLPQVSESGRYSLRLYINGMCRKLSIDDLLPFYPDGRPMSVSTFPNYDLWPSIIEKAYMKLMGGYDFPGSNSSTDIQILTAWIPEHVEINSASFESEKLWMRISQNYKQGLCMMTVGTGRRDAALLRLGDVQLLPTHSYAVLDIREEGEDRVVTVLNPWDGNDGSSSNELHEQVQNLTIQKQRDLFDVSWQDLCLAFDGLYLSWNPEVFRQNIEFHGIWKGKVDGNNSHCIHSHLSLDVGSAKPGNEIWVLLNRHFVDKNRTDEYISIHTQEDDVSHDSDNPATREYSLKGSYTSSTHTLARVILHDHITRVSIVASYDGDYEDVPFTLQVYTHDEVKWVTAPSRPMYSQNIEATFTTKNAGGNSLYPMFMNNPQYLLRIPPHNASKTANVAPDTMVRVFVEGPRSMPLNVMLVWSNGERIIQLKLGDVIADSGAYSYGIAQFSTSLKPGSYCIIVSAYEPRHRGAFTLRIESTTRLDLEPIPAEGAGMFCKSIKEAWRSGSAGGSPSFGNYHTNPTFELDLRSATSMKIRVQLLKPSPAIALNVTVFAAQDGRNLGRQITTSGPYTDNTSGAVTPQVNVAPGKYLVVASTYDPGILSEFQLLVYTKAADAVLKRLGQ